MPDTTRPETTQRVPMFPEERLRVRPWPDPVLDALGHDPRSRYVENYWLSILGPSSTLLLRRLAAGMEATPAGFDVDPLEWAQELGLGAKGGKHGPFWRSVDRACRFGAAQRNGQLLAVRRRLPPLTARQIERLPDHLQRAHNQWAEQRLAQPRRKTITHWSNHEASGRHGSAKVVRPGENPPDAASSVSAITAQDGRDRA